MSIHAEADMLEADSVIRETRAGRDENVGIGPAQWVLRPAPRVMEARTRLHERLAEGVVE